MKFDIRKDTNSWYLERINKMLKDLQIYVCSCADSEALFVEGNHYIESIRALVVEAQKQVVNPNFSDVKIRRRFIDLGGTVCEKVSDTSITWLFSEDGLTVFDDLDFTNIKVSESFQIAKIL